MRASTAARLMLGATLLVAGFGVMTDGAPTRGALAQSVGGWFDMKDRQCSHAPAAVGAACPRGCEARPIESSAGRYAPTECHSGLWISTCGKACAAKSGFARSDDGSLIAGGKLIVAFKGEPDEALLRELSSMGVTLTSRFDGLFRYDASVKGDVSRIKKRLSALPSAVSVEFVAR